MLSGVEAIHVATVLEDCVDQLAILGRIMPVSYEEKSDADEVCALDLFPSFCKKKKTGFVKTSRAGFNNILFRLFYQSMKISGS